VIPDQDMQALEKFAASTLQEDERSEVIVPVPSLVRRGAVYLISGALLITLVLLYVGQIDSVVTAPGKIVPEGGVIIVQAVEGGVVSAILARPGDRLERGAPILKLDVSESGVNLAELRRKTDFQKSQLDALRHDGAIMEEILRNPRAPLSQRPEATLTSVNSVALVSRFENARMRLDAALTQTTRQTGEQRDISLAEMAVQESLTDLRREAVNLGNQARELEGEIGAAEEKIRIAGNRLLLGSLRMPVSGTIVELKASNPGELLAAGAVVATIVPEAVPLSVDVNVPNKDIGLIKPGTPARVKVDAYPFQQYGTVPARVARVLPNTSKDNTFIVRLTLLDNKLALSGSQAFLFPGLTVQADVLTSKQSLIGLLFSRGGGQ
jgi:multidrug resistance efflux pump